jgi:hypothetical protein
MRASSRRGGCLHHAIPAPQLLSVREYPIPCFAWQGYFNSASPLLDYVSVLGPPCSGSRESLRGLPSTVIET